MAQYGIVSSTKSTYILASTPAAHYHGNGTLDHRAIFGNSAESFTGYDILANVPPGSVVASAITKYQKNNTVTGTIRLRAIVDAWEESVITWSSWFSSGRNVGTAFVDLAISALKGDHLFDVTAIVQEIVDNQYAGEGFYAVRTDFVNTNIIFNSDDSNANFPGTGPELTVVYTPPPAAISPVVEGLRYGIGPKRPQRTEVKSSYIASTQYDGEKKLMAVQFKNGRSFLYYEVPEDRYAEFMSAESKGRYYLKYIRGVYAAVPGDLD